MVGCQDKDLWKRTSVKRMVSGTNKGTTIALCTFGSQAENLIHQIIVLDIVPLFSEHPGSLYLLGQCPVFVRKTPSHKQQNKDAHVSHDLCSCKLEDDKWYVQGETGEFSRKKGSDIQDII